MTKITALLLLFYSISLGGQAVSKDHPFYLEIHSITDDIFIAVRPDATRQQVEGNTTVIINEKDVVVVDGNGAPIAARQVIKAIQARTKLPVAYLINTHGHGDHTGGNQAYLQAFPKVEIIAHPSTKKYMEKGGLNYINAIATETESRKQRGKNELAQLTAMKVSDREAIVSNIEQYYFKDLDVRSMAYQEIQITPPTATIAEDLTLFRGKREIKIYHPGFGKTASDLVVHLPKEKILITGDILTLPVPYGFSRNPDEWLKRLQEFAEMDVQYFIPGHGAVQSNKLYLNKVIGLIKTVKKQVQEGVQRGLEEQEILNQIEVEKEKRAITQNKAVLDYLFEKWTLKPLVNRYFLKIKESTTAIFEDDFEDDLSKWQLNNPEKIRIIDSGDRQHGKVLEMHPGGPNTFALIKGSENWKGAIVEGDVLFPENDHNYLGFIYNYQVNGVRADYGCIYIKGNSSYVRVNPHRDAHVSRILYDEYRTQLTGQDTIIAGKWQHFKAEVKDSVCHFYVGDMTTPKVTFPFFEFSSGKIGFEPRVIGSEVWIDNIKVQPLKELTFKGHQPQNIDYKKEHLLTQWQAIGPFRQIHEAIEKEGFVPTQTYKAHNTSYHWQPFQTDGRGCVVGGKILEWVSLKIHAYFHTNIAAKNNQKATLHFSTTNDLVVWLNGEKIGEIEGKFKAWYDLLDNPKHAGQKLEIVLKKGNNSLMILEKGMGWDGYAGDGFFVGMIRH